MEVGMAMLEIKYSKMDVIELIDHNLRDTLYEKQGRYIDFPELLEDLELDDLDNDISRKFEKRFTNVVSFLSKAEVRRVLGDPRGDVVEKDYFYSKQMTITRSDAFKVKNNAYQLNVFDVLFIMSLMLTYNHPTFALLRRSKNLVLRPEALMADWANEFEQILSLCLDVLWEKLKKDKNALDASTIKINLISLLWRLSPLIEKHNQGIYGDLAGIGAAFQALPEDLKEEFYTKKLASPLKKIKKELVDLIEGLKVSEDQTDYKKFRYNFDLEYDVYKTLNQLPEDPSLDDLSNFLKSNFYDEKNESKDDES